ncbi:hypothetical protein GQ457_01G025080 [Hibiscus cannabinus]
MSRKATEKLGLEVVTTAGTIKTINVEEVPIVGEVRKIELQIGEWKDKETFKVTHLDDYNFVLGLSFLTRIDALIVPTTDAMCILDPKHQCVMSTYQDNRRGTKKLSTIQLVEDAPNQGGIALKAATVKTTLEGQESSKPKGDMKPVEEQHMGKVEDAKDFEEKEVTLHDGGPDFTVEEETVGTSYVKHRRNGNIKFLCPTRDPCTNTEN